MRCSCVPVVLAGLALSLVLAVPPASGPERAAARAELDACAARIEALKARRSAGEPPGRELERLLVRAQELAAELQRARDELPPPLAMPSPEELRERADAARDEADRLAAAIAELDVRLGDARRFAAAGHDPTVTQALLGGGPRSSAAELRVQVLEERRARLAAERRRAEAEADWYEAEARDAEADR